MCDTVYSSVSGIENKAFLFSLLCFLSGILEFAIVGRHLGFTIIFSPYNNRLNIVSY